MKMKSHVIFFVLIVGILFFIFPFGGAGAKAPKCVYLTFDDCPTAYTEEILDLLAAHRAKATFFVLEAYAKQRPETVRRMQKEGHEIGLHGVTHKKELFYQNELSPLREMDEERVWLYLLTGKEYFTIRTPFGSHPYLTDAQRNRLNEAGYRLYDWSVDTKDALGACVPPQRVIERACRGIENEPEPIVLMHNMRSSCLALPAILDYLDDNGYQTALLRERKSN